MLEGGVVDAVVALDRAEVVLGSVSDWLDIISIGILVLIFSARAFSRGNSLSNSSSLV